MHKYIWKLNETVEYTVGGARQREEEKGVLTQQGSYGIGGPLMMMVDKTLFLERKGHNLQV